jgi:preprotein translocase subunit YajC
MQFALSLPLSSSLQDLAPHQIVAQEGGSLLGGLLPFIVILAAMYFLLIRPQQKRAKAQRELVASIGLGDRIVTLGGIHGTVESIDDDTLRLEVAPSATITVARSSVGRRIVSPHTGADVDDEA